MHIRQRSDEGWVVGARALAWAAIAAFALINDACGADTPSEANAPMDAADAGDSVDAPAPDAGSLDAGALDGGTDALAATDSPIVPPDANGPGTLVSAALGGTVHSADGVYEIEIPPGALDHDTVINIETLTANAVPADVAATMPLGAVYAVEPDGLTFGGGGAIERFHFATVPAGMVTPSANGVPAEYKLAFPVTRPAAGGAITEALEPKTTYAADGSLRVEAKLAHLSLHWTTAEFGAEVFSVGVDFGAETHEVGDEWAATAIFSSTVDFASFSFRAEPTPVSGFPISARAPGGPNSRDFYDVATPPEGHFTHGQRYAIAPAPAWGCDAVGDDIIGINVSFAPKYDFFVESPSKFHCVAATPPPAKAIWADEAACHRFPGGELDCTDPPHAKLEVTTPAATTPDTGLGTTAHVLPVTVASRTDGPTSIDVTGGINGGTATLDTSGPTPSYPVTGVTTSPAFDNTQSVVFTTNMGATTTTPVPTSGLSNLTLRNANALRTNAVAPQTGFGAMRTDLVFAAAGSTTPAKVISEEIPAADMPVVNGERVAPLASDMVNDYIAAEGLVFLSGRSCLANSETGTALLPGGAPITYIAEHCVTYDAATLAPPSGACADLPEICDGLDNNCNAKTDEGCPSTFTMAANGAVTSPTYGTPVAGNSSQSVTCPTYGVIAGVRGREVTSIWQLSPFCSGVTMTVDKAQTPYLYSIVVGAPSTPGFPLGGSTGGGTGTQFDRVCPAGMMVDGMTVTAGTNLGALQLVCASWELQRRPGNRWVLERVAPQTLPIAGSGPGTVTTWLAPKHSSGTPEVFHNFTIGYAPGTPIATISATTVTAILKVNP